MTPYEREIVREARGALAAYQAATSYPLLTAVKSQIAYEPMDELIYRLDKILGDRPIEGV